MILDHNTSHTGQFVKNWDLYMFAFSWLKEQESTISLNTRPSSESRINHISIDVWFGQYLKIWNLRVQKNLNIEKIIFKVVQMKFLAMHITNQKLCLDIFTVGILLNIFMEHDLNI